MEIRMTFKKCLVVLCLGFMALGAQADESLSEKCDDFIKNQFLSPKVSKKLEKEFRKTQERYRLSRKNLGETHPDTTKLFYRLIKKHLKLGHREKAFVLLEEAYRLRKDFLEEKNIDALSHLERFASLYSSLGHLSQLSLEGTSSLERLSRVWGDSFFRSLNKALFLYEKSYRLSMALLGETHPKTTGRLVSLVWHYSRLARREEALVLLEEGYRLRKNFLNKKNSDALSQLERFASLYSLVGHLDKAWLLDKKRYRLAQEIDPTKADSMLYMFTARYPHSKKLQEAVLQWLKKAYQLKKKQLGETHSSTLRYLERLSEFDFQSGHPDALPWLEKRHRLTPSIMSRPQLIGYYAKSGRLDKTLPFLKKSYQLSLKSPKSYYGETSKLSYGLLIRLVHTYIELGLALDLNDFGADLIRLDLVLVEITAAIVAFLQDV